MGFWQNLASSYDKNVDALQSRYPISTTTISNNGGMVVVIVINVNGDFCTAKTIDKAKKDKTGKSVVASVQICMPVTERSMGRSGSIIAPHPVFDQYEYLIGNGKKFDEYLSELAKFAGSEFATQQVKSIYQYIAKKTVKRDLEKIAPENKTHIIFEVETPADPQVKVWENKAFFDAWNSYYLKQKENTRALDYITGDNQPIASSHPKKIVRISANAKLISNNDDKNFTFLGKFQNSSEAFSIGYETSQKAHQFLRYLINDRGYYCGDQVILSFTIGSIERMLPPPLDEKCIWDFLQETGAKTESDNQISLRAETGFEYADELRKALAGYGHSEALSQHPKTAVMALDAATTGRLSITFYRELDRAEYLEKIIDWHMNCKWNRKFWDAVNQKYVSYFGAPPVDTVIEVIYGKPRSHNDEGYVKIKKAARERLLRCIFDGEALPRDYIMAAIRRVSNPFGITQDGKFDRNGFYRILSTACALVRRDHQQRNKEDCKMSIEFDRTDRDYLYGRLLGAADKLEEYALYKTDKDRVLTAAIRHMQTFAQRPFRTWQTIHGCLNPYIKVVKGGFAYHEIEAIKCKFLSVDDYQKDVPLGGLYLIGYYHERAYIECLVNKAINKKQAADYNEKENDNV